jgi:epoxide hydrolase 4
MESIMALSVSAEETGAFMRLSCLQTLRGAIAEIRAARSTVCNEHGGTGLRAAWHEVQMGAINPDNPTMPHPASAFETITIDTGGLTFECLRAGQGNGKLAILLHGFPEAHFSWRHQIAPLVSAGYEVIAPDQRGYGRSSKPKGVAAYDIAHLMADVAGIIDVAANDRPVTLIAHDWGAIVAWCFAARKVRALERLVVMNVPHPARMAEELATWEQRRKSWYVFFFQLPLLPELLLGANRAAAIGRAFTGMARDRTRFEPDLIDAFRDHAATPGALTGMINWYRAATRGGLAAYRREAVAEITVPTLMIWGEDDDALGIRLTDGYEGLVRDFTLHRLPGVSHWVQQEAPERVNAILIDWLSAK